MRIPLRKLVPTVLAAAVFPGLLGETTRAEAPSTPICRLHFYHTHTGERLDVVYRQGDVYDPEALPIIARYLRDHRTGNTHAYDTRVLDFLHDVTVALGRPDAEIEVICGYRTPRSNEYLRGHGHGVARQSLHMKAMAIDFRIPGVPTREVRDAAMALNRGGVGYYGRSDFVHLDVGRIRHW